jgi:hypothetical protein
MLVQSQIWQPMQNFHQWTRRCSLSSRIEAQGKRPATVFVALHPQWQSGMLKRRMLLELLHCHESFNLQSVRIQHDRRCSG